MLTTPLRIDDPAERGERHAQRDAVLGQHLLRGDLDRLRTQVEALDLDLAAGRPEGVTARREPLHEPALDVEQAGLVVLDHGLGDERLRARATIARCRGATFGSLATSMRSTSMRVTTFQNTRVCHGPSRCTGRPSKLTMATSSAFVSTASNTARREVRPCRLEHREALRREFGAHDVAQLDRKLPLRVEQGVAARLEHLLEPAVAHQEGALAVLHRHAQHNRCRFMAHLLLGFRRCRKPGFVRRGCGFRTRLPAGSAGRGLSLR